MATLNEITYNIKELLSGGGERNEQKISTRQIKHWVHYHRAKIIEEKLLAGAPLDRNWIQPIKSCSIFPEVFFSFYLSQTAQTSYPNNDTYGITEKSAWANNNYYGKNYLEDDDNQYYIYTKEMPNTINVGNRDGITDARIKRRAHNLGNDNIGQFTGWSPVSIKTKDEAQYAWANKFTKIKTPYAVPYNENHATKLEIGGLRIRPNRDNNDVIYEYGLETYGILQNPTKSVRWDWSNNSNDNMLEFDEILYNDSIDSYPISSEDLPLLISRVAEVEMTLLLKTPLDLIEDNTNTPKINIGQPEK
jgi:hypothetical protein